MDQPVSTSRNDRDMVTITGPQPVHRDSSSQAWPCFVGFCVFVPVVIIVSRRIGLFGGLVVGFLFGLCGPTLFCAVCHYLRPDQLTGYQERVATLGDKARRRTLLHYFVAPPDNKEPAGRGSLERGSSESNTTADMGGDRLDEEGADGSCIICLGDFTSGEQLCRLPCLHLYHAQCIDEWLDGPNHHSCPLCKTSVFVSAGAIPPATDRGTTPTTNTSNTTPISTNSNPQGSHDVV